MTKKKAKAKATPAPAAKSDVFDVSRHPVPPSGGTWGLRPEQICPSWIDKYNWTYTPRSWRWNS